MRDLTDGADLEALLRRFYGRAFEDDLLGHVFVDVVGLDLEAHLPVIAGFWERVLFDTGAYTGRTMAVHRRVHEQVALTPAHFTRWLELWHRTLGEMFAGPVADAAAAHADRMAPVFLRNLASASPRELPVVTR